MLDAVQGVTGKAGNGFCQDEVNFLLPAQFNKSFPNRRTIENSDLCANTPKKYSFSGKLAINRSITPLLRLELSSREAFEGRSSLKNKP